MMHLFRSFQLADNLLSEKTSLGRDLAGLTDKLPQSSSRCPLFIAAFCLYTVGLLEWTLERRTTLLTVKHAVL